MDFYQKNNQVLLRLKNVELGNIGVFFHFLERSQKKRKQKKKKSTKKNDKEKEKKRKEKGSPVFSSPIGPSHLNYRRREDNESILNGPIDRYRVDAAPASSWPKPRPT